MGRIFVVELEGRSYRCKFCKTHLALASDCVSRGFHCRRGKAYLFSNVVNITIGALEERMMLSGLHTVADTFCCCCGQIVGWKYVLSLSLIYILLSFCDFFLLKIFCFLNQETAHENTQKYKEGKFVLERGRIVEEVDFSTEFDVDSDDA